MTKKEMTILIIGKGGREHAISHAYEKSEKVKKIIIAPGNDFISFKRQKDISCDNNCSLNDPESILKIAKKYKPDLIDVSQNETVKSETVDILKKEGFQVFGPNKKSSKIEWDEKWSRELMQNQNIPLPKFKYFESEERALGYVEGLYQDKNRTIYIKSSKPEENKETIKATNIKEALSGVNKIKKLQKSEENFLIEEALTGEEFSYHIISDGKNYQIFNSSKNYKQAYNFDIGTQTSGMGAVSPAKITEKITEQVEEDIIQKVIDGMNKENISYKGILCINVIINEDKITALKFTSRWSETECQAILPSLETDYLEIVLATINGNLKSIQIKQDNKVRICLIGTSKGYPHDYLESKGKTIYGLEKEKDDVQIFGEEIKIENNKFYTNGGKLFSIVAEGNNILEAKEKVYQRIAGITIEGNSLHYRTDIGWREIESELNDQQSTDYRKRSTVNSQQSTDDDTDELEEEDDEDWTIQQEDQDNEDNGEKYWATEEDLEPVDPDEVRFQKEMTEEEE